MSEGTIVKWYKKEGDAMEAGDLLCDIQVISQVTTSNVKAVLVTLYDYVVYSWVGSCDSKLFLRFSNRSMEVELSCPSRRL